MVILQSPSYAVFLNALFEQYLSLLSESALQRAND